MAFRSFLDSLLIMFFFTSAICLTLEHEFVAEPDLIWNPILFLIKHLWQVALTRGIAIKKFRGGWINGFALNLVLIFYSLGF